MESPHFEDFNEYFASCHKMRGEDELGDTTTLFNFCKIFWNNKLRRGKQKMKLEYAEFLDKRMELHK